MSAATGVLNLVHPVVRIVSFLLFGLFLALGNLSQIAIAGILLAILFFQAGSACLVNSWPMLRRMRWFFLSIVVIYAWLTPGLPLWASGPVSWWMPTIEGVFTAGHRLLALTMMVLAVQWLLWVTTRAQLVSALYWLATPLVLIGFSRERFAVRVALVLGTIEQVQGRVSQQIKEVALERGDLRGYAAVAASLVSDVVQQGEQESCHLIEIDIENSPSLWQWLWPLALSGVMLLAA
jgi:energy-coupling factor transport system permease protein